MEFYSEKAEFFTVTLGNFGPPSFEKKCALSIFGSFPTFTIRIISPLQYIDFGVKKTKKLLETEPPEDYRKKDRDPILSTKKVH